MLTAVMWSRRERPAGLLSRSVAYMAAAALVAVAGVCSPSVPNGGLLLLAALSAAHIAAMVFPVVMGTVGMWRARRTVAGTVVAIMGLLIPAPTAILIVAFDAIVSGVHIRRFRTTPGRLPMGASRTIIQASAVFLVMDLLPTQSAEQVFVAAYAAAAVARRVDLPMWVSMVHLALGHSLRETVMGRMTLFDHAWRAADASFVAIAWCLATLDLRLLLLLVPPYAMALVAGTYNGKVVRQRQFAELLRELSVRLHAETSAREVERITVDTLAATLGTTVDVVATPPSVKEIGAFLSWGTPRWVVARERFGPPTLQGRFLRDERAFVESVAELTASPAEAITLVERLRAASLTDELTGLPNRRAVRQRLHHDFEVAVRTGEVVSVLFIDVDRFKQINTDLGHDVADQVLTTLADRLKSTVRSTDLVGRWGGEEFVAVTRGDAVEIAERLLGTTRAPVPLAAGETRAVTVSIGLARGHPSNVGPDDVIRAADLAMLAAKEAGRNRLVIADPVVAAPGTRRRAMAS